MNNKINQKTKDEVYNNYLKVANETIIQDEIIQSTQNTDATIKIVKQLKTKEKYNKILTKGIKNSD